MLSRHLAVLSAIEDELRARVGVAADTLGGDGTAAPSVSLGPTRDPLHGDFATAVALAAGKAWRVNPMDVAAAIASRGAAGMAGVAKIDVAKPGFLNFRMAPDFWTGVVKEALERGESYGTSDALAAHGPLLVEFTSPNPTGPLVVVQGRSGSLGATLVAMFRFAGAKTEAETYVNDAGNQLDTLADSLFARYATLCGVETPVPEDGYPGDYLIDVARRLRERDGDRWLSAPFDERRRALGRFGRDLIVEGQRQDMERFGVHFDRWFSEASLHESGKIEAVLELLTSSGHAYVKDDALFLKSTEFGDEKDRVLRRSDGRPTYLAADAAYHRDKLERGNAYLLNILGPDHHGYIARLKALVAALGHPGSLEVLLAQQVTLKRGDEVVKMSKRAGNVITLADVMDEVGVDAARFFFINRAPESHLVFDLELALEQSAKNPVYYVQYGHARIASILRRASAPEHAQSLERARRGDDLAALAHPAEFALIRRIADYERTVVDAARARAPHRVAEFARDLATDFHAFYTDCVVLGDDAGITSARLSLCIVAKTALASALKLLGVSAPEKM
ncbi:MAG TPA: arginine--tRNA ligase [Candidatus Eremiobacteraceae bacterium]|nr:arginine--tRNA ligase [Candidatus Eremiobacteraceae bacterium]